MNDDRRRSVYFPPWRVDVVTRAGVRGSLAISVIATATARALEASGAPAPGSVAIVLTDDEELTDLNREHMGIDGPTDVLSFPMLPPETFRRDAAAGARARRSTSVAPVGRGARTHIGDIAISVERAIDQAARGRGGQTGDICWSAADELRLLVTHGTLHLCGWDHAQPDEEAAMRSVERGLLSKRPG